MASDVGDTTTSYFYSGTEATTATDSNWTDTYNLQGSNLRIIYDAAVTPPAVDIFALKLSTGNLILSGPLTIKTPPKINTTNLVLHLDAGDSNSYVGSGTTWTDLSGQGNHATLVNGPTYSSNNGGYLSFDGSNDHATLPAIDLTGNEITFSIWTQIIDNNPLSAMIFFGDSGASGGSGRILGVFLPYAGNNYYFDKGWDGSAYDRLSSTSTLQNSDWQNVWVNWTFTANASTGSMKIYRNASLFDSGTGYTKTFTNANGDMRTIAKFYNGHYEGYISNLQLYKKELSASEVTQNYNVLKSRFGY